MIKTPMLTKTTLAAETSIGSSQSAQLRQSCPHAQAKDWGDRRVVMKPVVQTRAAVLSPAM
jgi:hypothetical protein